MAEISRYLRQIQLAGRGDEVRDALVGGLSAMNRSIRPAVEEMVTEVLSNGDYTGPKGDPGNQGPAGPYYVPSIDENGNLSWSNTGGMENPESVNICGPKGDQGEKGEKGNAFTFADFTAEQLASLKGERGDDGVSPQVYVTDVTGGHNLSIVPAADSEPSTVLIKDGVSPTVEIEEVSGGHRLTITDESHPNGQTIDLVGGTSTVQTPDWNQNDDTADDFIKNKPFYTAPEFISYGLFYVSGMTYGWTTTKPIWSSKKYQYKNISSLLPDDSYAEKPFRAGERYKIQVCTNSTDTPEVLYETTAETVEVTANSIKVLLMRFTWNNSELCINFSKTDNSAGVYVESPYTFVGNSSSNTVGVRLWRLVEVTHKIEEKYIPDLSAYAPDFRNYSPSFVVDDNNSVILTYHQRQGYTPAGYAALRLSSILEEITFYGLETESKQVIPAMNEILGMVQALGALEDRLTSVESVLNDQSNAVIRLSNTLRQKEEQISNLAGTVDSLFNRVAYLESLHGVQGTQTASVSDSTLVIDNGVVSEGTLSILTGAAVRSGTLVFAAGDSSSSVSEGVLSIRGDVDNGVLNMNGASVQDGTLSV